MRFYLHLDPMSLITEGPDGELNCDKYVQEWAGLEWVLRREQQMRLR
ncbi:hypothetical protein [Hymenobacter sp. UV11]|nr:hypothetical protein [Hymenobacter sp. UV11]